MRIALLRIGDGRDETHERSWASLVEHLPRVEDEVTVDDRDHELGFAGAIQRGWEQIPAAADYVFHAELDFLYAGAVPLERMAAVLRAHPYLVQMALKRQPCNERERKAGGIVEADPDAFEQRVEHGDIWTEHRKFFTTNPSLYPAALCRQGWPQESESEGKFSARLFEDPRARSGFWGAKLAPPLITHIGERVGRGY